MLYPVIPDSSLKALKIFNINENEIDLSSITKHDYLKPGNKINPIDILFKKMMKGIPTVLFTPLSGSEK